MRNTLIASTLLLASTPLFANTMSCYVDTPAYDQFSKDFCFSSVFEGPTTTSAVFRIDNAPSNLSSVIWSDSACSSTATTCITTIRAYRPKTVTATVLKTDGTYFQVSATAEYELGL